VRLAQVEREHEDITRRVWLRTGPHQTFGIQPGAHVVLTLEDDESGGRLPLRLRVGDGVRTQSKRFPVGA
jgi:hypothetical protein